MAAITAKDVMSLRNRTGLGMMECKKALTEADGDADAAIKILQEQLKGKMDLRTDREAGEGTIAIAKADDGNSVAIIQLQSETDFAAKNDTFVAAADNIATLALSESDGTVTASDAMTVITDELRFTIKENIAVAKAAKLSGEKVGSYLHHNRQVGVIITGTGDLSDELLTGICQHIAASVPPPDAVDEAGLDPAAVEAQKQAAIAEAQASGKPEQIAEKIATGKLRKWVDDNTLMGQVYLREMDAKKPVRDYLPKDASITAFVRYKLGE